MFDRALQHREIAMHEVANCNLYENATCHSKLQQTLQIASFTAQDIVVHHISDDAMTQITNSTHFDLQFQLQKSRFL